MENSLERVHQFQQTKGKQWKSKFAYLSPHENSDSVERTEALSKSTEETNQKWWGLSMAEFRNLKVDVTPFHLQSPPSFTEIF